MKTTAAVLHKTERPQPYADSQPMVIEELELEGPGEGEVLVEVKGAGLCHSDLSTINGSRPRQTPMVLGVAYCVLGTAGTIWGIAIESILLLLPGMLLLLLLRRSDILGN